MMLLIEVLMCHPVIVLFPNERLNIAGKADDNERSSAAGRKRKAAAPVSETGAGSETAGSLVFTHWLMKSEPESRFENGIDVKVKEAGSSSAETVELSALVSAFDRRALFLQFGIEDLKALPDQTGCWDGVRNYQVGQRARLM